MEHSQLDFIATKITSDFFHTLSNFISHTHTHTHTHKNILSTILSYASMATLILFLIIILPYIVKTLQQSTQKLATKLHLAVLKKIKKGDMLGASMENPTHGKVMRKRPDGQR